jgi:1,4-dihydroxy-2-naphthoate polyprenyltransferase
MNVWVEAARPRTLPAAVVPVAVGTLAAVAPADVDVLRAGLALLVALALQVAVNLANDLFDGLAGIDTDERIGPRRVVAAGLVTPRTMRTALIATLVVAALAGLALAVLVDLRLLAFGALAVLATLGYSGGARPYASRALGEVAVFVFFGLVATVGSAYVQTGSVALVAVLSSLPVGLLAVALLMINNVRDVETDTATGKRTLAVRIGARRYGHAYGLVMVVPFLLLVPVTLAVGSPAPLLALGAAPLLTLAARRARAAARTDDRHERGAAYVAALGATAGLQLAFGVLLAEWSPFDEYDDASPPSGWTRRSPPRPTRHRPRSARTCPST